MHKLEAPFWGLFVFNGERGFLPLTYDAQCTIL